MRRQWSHALPGAAGFETLLLTFQIADVELDLLIQALFRPDQQACLVQSPENAASVQYECVIGIIEQDGGEALACRISYPPRSTKAQNAIPNAGLRTSM